MQTLKNIQNIVHILIIIFKCVFQYIFQGKKVFLQI